VNPKPSSNKVQEAIAKTQIKSSSSEHTTSFKPENMSDTQAEVFDILKGELDESKSKDSFYA